MTIRPSALLLAFALTLQGCQQRPSSTNETSGSSPQNQSRVARASSPTRSAYLEATHKAREEAKTERAKKVAEPTPSQDKVLYQGPTAGAPPDLLNRPGIELHYTVKKPGEVKVVQRS